MKRLLVIFALLLNITALSFASITQKGKVFVYVGKEELAPGRNISLRINGCESVVTDDEGCFEMVFRNKKHGSPIADIIIETPGYLLVNREYFNQWKLSKDKSMELVLCEERLYEIIHNNNLSDVTSFYQKTYVESKEDLGSMFDYNLESLDNYVDDFTRLHIISNDELNSKGYKMFREGKIKDILELYENANLLEAYKENLRTNKEKDIRVKLRAYIDLLGMSAVPDDYIKSLDIAKQFYELNPHNEYVALKYADHLFELERYDESQVIYNKVKRSKNLHYAVRALASLAVIANSKGDFTKAQSLGLQGLSRYQQAVAKAKDDSLYLTEEMILHSSLMLSYMNSNDRSKSERHMRQAVELSRKLYDYFPYTYARQHAITLNNAAVVCRTINNSEEGQNLAKESIEIGKILITRSKMRDSKILAMAYLQMANMLNDSLTHSESEAYYIKAEQTYEECLLSNPIAYRGPLAACYENHSILYMRDLDKYRDKAEQYLKRSRYLLEEIHKTMPEFAAFPLSMVYHDLYVVFENNDNVKAIYYAKKGLNLLEELSNKYGNDMLPYLGVAQLDFAKALVVDRQYAKALSYFESALVALPDNPEVLSEIEKLKEIIK